MINTNDNNLTLEPFTDVQPEVFVNYNQTPEIQSYEPNYDIDISENIERPMEIAPQSNLQITPNQAMPVPEKREFVPEFGVESSQAQGHRPGDGGNKISDASGENYRRSLADGIGNSNKLEGASKKEGPRFASRNLASNNTSKLPENRTNYF